MVEVETGVDVLVPVIDVTDWVVEVVIFAVVELVVALVVIVAA